MLDYVELCINEALISAKSGDVPIGAIIVRNGEVLVSAHNTREKDKNILGHAEINAISLAAKTLNRWNLSDCDLYVTLEPCSMCKTVINQSRIANVYYLLSKLDFKKEYNKTNFHKIDQNSLNRHEQMYSFILSDFFKSKR